MIGILLRFSFLNSLSRISTGSSTKFNLASTWISSKGTCSVGSAKHFLSLEENIQSEGEEDTAYLCLHFTRNHEEQRPIRRIQELLYDWMTRKDQSEIVSPFSNLEQAFRKLNKKEQVVESKGFSQKDFEFESVLESEFQSKEKEEMGDDNRTMADLAKTTRTRASSAITREDVDYHIDTFLGVCKLFKIKDVDGNAIKLRVFPFTLTGTAKEWLKSNAPGSITTWDQMQE
ncbi:hypothetical protein Tco_1026083 [Tanacetum coccineum]